MVTAYDDSPEAMLARPTFRCSIYNGDDEHVATIVAYSTADALATFLDRMPERGRAMFAVTVRSLRRKHDDALRRWDRHGNTQGGRAQLVCPRWVGNHPEADPIFSCSGAEELLDV